MMHDSPSPLASVASLYVVATPLGNAHDISLRALDILKAVDVVAAEDTRHSQRLLDFHGVSAKMLALHEHNEQEGASHLLRLLEAGKHVALITDAGTPAVSDPGARVVARVQEQGFPVVPIPGACAAIAALSVSGLTAPHFFFYGFLPVKSAARRAALEGLIDLSATLVLYEAPHRILECVDDCLAILGPKREIVVCRELTKMFEQVARMPLSDAPAWLAADPNRQRGEFVLLVSAAQVEEGVNVEAERVLRLLLAELPVKSAAKLAAQITGTPKNELYARALAIKDDG